MYDLQELYHIICVLVTISLVCWVSYEYSLNDDETQVHVKEFHKTSDDIYPSTTICLTNNMPFIEEKLNEFDPLLTIANYRRFLSGIDSILSYDKESVNIGWNESWIDIDYDYVTYQLEDLVTQVEMHFLENEQEDNTEISWVAKNNSLIRWELDSGESLSDYNAVIEMDTLISARASWYKCFTIDMPYIQGVNLNVVMIKINASIFSDGEIMPKNNDFDVTFGYPNQLIRSREKNKVIFDKKVASTSNYLLETYLGSMEVIRRRDKHERRCNENWQNQDEDDLSNIIEKVGCNPKHWKTRSNLPYCLNQRQYLAAMTGLKLKAASTPPCKSIEKLIQMTYETDQGLEYSPSFEVHVYFKKETMYKEIRLVRAFNLQSLIGNAGKEIQNCRFGI